MKTLASPILLAGLANAYRYEAWLGTGAGSQREAAQLFQEANANPDRTKAQAFNLSIMTDAAMQSNLGPNLQSDITWRINVSDVAVPNATTGPEDEALGDDPHVANTVYSFEFPDLSPLGRLQDGTSNSFQPFCVTVFTIAPDIMDRFESNDQGDCTSMLGERCLQAMRDRHYSSYSSCDAPSFHFVEECEDVLQNYSAVTWSMYDTAPRTPWWSASATTSTSSAGSALPSASRGVSNGTEEYDRPDALRSGEPVYWRASAAHAGDDASAFDEALDRVQMVYFHARQDVALCTRVRARASGERESGDEDNGGGNGAGRGQAGWVLLVLGVLGSVMAGL